MEQTEDTKQPIIIEKLLKKMDASPGFAGLGGAVQKICRLVDEDGSNKEIVSTILRDPALTSKLLQIANSGSNMRGGRNISKIDQVLAILGLNTVKSVALSLALLGSLSNKVQAKQLHAEIVAAFFTGSFAAEITRIYGSSFSTQEAQVCGLLQNLGRMMSIYYLYEEIEQISKLKTDRNLTEADAVMEVLGVSFEGIGHSIACHWGLPDVLQNSLSPDTLSSPPQAALNAEAWFQICSLFCRRMTDVLFRLQESRVKIEIANCIDFFNKSLHLKEKEVFEFIDKILLETDTILSGMSFPCDVADARSLLRKASEQSLDTLSSHDSLVKKDKHSEGDQTPIEIIKHTMRLIHSHYSFDCTLICLVDKSSGLLTIAGVGRNAAQLTTKFRSTSNKQDIFQMIMARCIDAYIPDVSLPKYSSIMPAWYQEHVGAKSFVMIPLLNEGKPVGMMYGDFTKPQLSAPSGFSAEPMVEWRKKLVNAILAGSKTSKV